MPPGKKTLQALAKLPQKALAWHLTTRQLHTWITEEDEQPARPLIFLITIPEKKAILFNEIVLQPPDEAQVEAWLLEAMRRPETSTGLEPHRPQQVAFEEARLAQALAPLLSELGVKAVHQPPLAEVDELIHLFDEFMESEQPSLPGLLEAPGVTPEHVGALFAAAASYFRAEPWKRLADSQPVRVVFSPSGEERFVQLMGNAGMQYGLIMHLDWNSLLRSYQHFDDPLERLGPDGWQSFSFEEANLLPSADLDSIEKYGWPVAAANAYPLPATYTADDLLRPNRQEIVQYEALLRAIPRFVKRLAPGEEDYQPLQTTLQVETSEGSLSLTLAYPAGELPEELFTGQDYEEGFFIDLEDDEDFEDEFEDDEDLEDEKEIDAELTALAALDPALAQAQMRVFLAWEFEGEECVRLAHQALEISPDCAEAYALLADENAKSAEEAYEYFLKGVQAGERALGEAYFTKHAGHFWELAETRPYLRTRYGLAESLLYLERYSEALQHFREMLRLNPGDNQGVRYLLMSQYLEQKQDALAWQLLEAYAEDTTAAWAYARTLLAFRKKGDSTQASAALRRALRANPYVPAFLLGSRPLPEEPPDYIEAGDENEAVEYVLENYTNWWNTPGAAAWLKAQTGEASRGQAPRQRHKRK